jgi:hypothetical protein
LPELSTFDGIKSNKKTPRSLAGLGVEGSLLDQLALAGGTLALPPGA